MKKGLCLILIAVLLFSAFAVSGIVVPADGIEGEEVQTDVKTGWVSENGNWRYFDENGNVKTGWLKDNGKWYYLDENGFVTLGWKKIDGYYFYFRNGGAMRTGWFKDNGKWYFLRNSGRMHIGWLKTDGKWYYMTKSGAMKTGWLKDGGKWYYTDKSGVMQTGWQKIDGSWYFLNKSGSMASGFIENDGSTYYLYPSGKYYCGWVTKDQVFSSKQIKSAAKDYSVNEKSNTFLSLLRINKKYSQKLSTSEKSGTLLFFMEGAGRTDDISVRKDAVCVLVRNGEILYMNINCSTIPDCPFDPSRNYGDPMPTLKSGIYDFTTVYHSSAYTQCAGMNVENAKVVRHRSQNDYYSSTSTGIHIHRRNRDYVAVDPSDEISSAGCLVIGNSGKKSTDEYAEFSAILGITNPGDSGTASVKNYVSGKVIVDRYFARDYLKSIGYTDGAIDLIG